MTRTIHAARAAALCALLLSASILPALAGWQDDYKEGRTAVEENQPKRAERYLRSALEKKDVEKANAIKATGMFFENYLPHFYLGQALFQQQRYEEAIKEFDLSEAQGVIDKDAALMAQLTQTRKIARQLAEAAKAAPPTPAPPVPAPPPATAQNDKPGGSSGGSEPSGQESTGKESASSRSTTTTAEPLKPSGPDPALVGAIDAAAGDIAAAQKLKATAGSDLRDGEGAQLDAAASAVRDASSPAEARSRHDALKQLTSDLSARVEQRRQERSDRAALDKARKSAGSTVAAGRKLLSEKGGDLKNSEKSRLTREIEAVEKAGSAGEVEKAARTLGGDISDLQKALAQRAAAANDAQAREAALASARKAYAGAVEAYYKGDYSGAVNGLETASDDLTGDPEIHAMMGSALYKQYVLGRSRDGSLKDRAEAAFRAALKLKADYRLDPAWYPPKVIAFFNQVAGRGGPAGQ